MRIKALKAAFPHTLPILVGFLFLGTSYGFLMKSQGFSILYSLPMSIFIFAGSMQFVAVNVLLAAFNPLSAFFLTLLVNARHLFYGLSLLEKFQHLKWKKFYLIFGLCDETYSIECAVNVPAGVDRGWFFFFVTLLDHLYWITGTAVGALLGEVIHFDTTGIDFVMTALFIVLFLGQWEESDGHRPALIGLGGAALCLLIFGSKNFILPAMALIVLCLALDKKRLNRQEMAQ